MVHLHMHTQAWRHLCSHGDGNKLHAPRLQGAKALTLNIDIDRHTARGNAHRIHDSGHGQHHGIAVCGLR